MIDHNTSNKGVTLVEALIAAAILATGILAASTMVARSTIQDSKAYYMTKASMLVEEFLEEESNKQYSWSKYNSINSTSKNWTIDGIDYNMTCSISLENPENFCKEMTCSIDWNNKGTPAATTYVYSFCNYRE